MTPSGARIRFIEILTTAKREGENMRHDRNALRRGAVGGAAAVAALLALAACGSSSSSSSSSSASAPASAAASASGAASASAPASSASAAAGGDAAALVAKMSAGAFSAPAGDPLPIQKGKSLFIVSCGQSLVVCSEPVQGVVDAAQAAGWTTKIYDTQTDPAKFGAGVSQGIAAKPDAIVLMSIDCSLAKSPVQQAIDAGIQIMTMQSIDCNDAAGDGSAALYTGREPLISGYNSFADWQRAMSGDRLAWVAEQTGGKANILLLNEPEYPIYQAITQGAEAGIKQYCPDCTVTSMDFSFADAGAKFQQKVQQALLQNPDTNVILAPDDSTVLSGVSAAVTQAGKTDSVKVVGFGGDPASIDLIRTNGGQNMTLANDFRWWGWAAVDSLNSLFQGKPLRDSGMGVQLIDKTNAPAGDYATPIDYATAYKALWGVG